MFTFETVVDAGAKTAKKFADMVTNKEIQKELVSLIDTSADFYKNTYNSTVDIAQKALESFPKVDLEKFDFTKNSKK
jgi:hypothetical protein|tara:strand:- start:1562 stop:1792 length:231 start_codon:yes stop_codon:yes gene_type:complete